MRRLADLQIEQAYGVIGTGRQGRGDGGPRCRDPGPKPDVARERNPVSARRTRGIGAGTFEATRITRRARKFSVRLRRHSTCRIAGLGRRVDRRFRGASRGDRDLRERFSRTYPNYERNDQVLYQMSRAYDESDNPMRRWRSWTGSSPSIRSPSTRRRSALSGAVSIPVRAQAVS